MRQSIKYSLLIVSLLITSQFLGQGRVDGFIKGKGDLDLVLGGSFEINKKYFAGTTKINLTRDIRLASVFVAYGITNKLEVNFSLPYVNVNGAVKGIQDPAIFFKYKYFERKGGVLKTDFILAAGFSSNITKYQTEGGSALGQQAKVIDIRPVFQIYLPKSLFFTIQTGYSYKFSPVPNSVPLAVKFGIAKAKLYIDVWYEYQYSFGGLDYRGTPVPSTFRELGVDYHKIGGTIYKPIGERLGAFLGASYVLLGRNVSQGFGINLGVVFKF